MFLFYLLCSGEINRTSRVLKVSAATSNGAKKKTGLGTEPSE